jgi:hypothetical protein
VTPWRELHVSESSQWVHHQTSKEKMHLDAFERAIKQTRWILQASEKKKVGGM